MIECEEDEGISTVTSELGGIHLPYHCTLEYGVRSLREAMVPNQAKPASNPAQPPKRPVCHISVHSSISLLSNSIQGHSCLR